MSNFSDYWKQRYGSTPEFSVEEISEFLGHRSIRRYSDEAISDDLMKLLVGAAQSASTSSNLQLWSIVSVQNQDLRMQIAECCANQKQVLNAPAFLVFLADLNRLYTIAKENNMNPEALNYAEFALMATIDASLAAERMVCAAEKQGLGVCYIGALRNNPFRVKELLHLPDRVLGVFGLCLGWPRDGDTSSVKPRLAQESVFFTDRYPDSFDVAEYDKRSQEFNEGQGRGHLGLWSERSSERALLESITGRDVILEYLHQSNMLLK